MKNWRKLSVIGVGAASLFIVYKMAFSTKGSRRPSSITTVTRGTLVQRVTVAGTVVPKRRTIFAPPYNAYVKKIYVGIGQQVKAGEPIVTFTQSLRGQEEETYPMRAPYAGTVVLIPRSEGEYVETSKENNAVVRIDDLNQLYVYCDIAEGEMQKIKIGQEVVIKANAVLDHNYKGVIRDMARAPKEKKDWDSRGDQVQFEARIEVLDKDELLLPGMSVTIDILSGKKEDVLLLPIEYVEKTKGKYFVTAENGEKVQVEVGMQNEESFEILSGLKEKEAVKMVDFFALPSER